MTNDFGIITDPEVIVLHDGKRHERLSIEVGQHNGRWYFGIHIVYPNGGMSFAPGPGHKEDNSRESYQVKNEAIAAAISHARYHVEKMIAWYGEREERSCHDALQKLLYACRPPQRTFSFISEMDRRET